MVINNAGTMNNYKLLETDPCLIESSLKTNIHPQFYMAKYAVKHFIKTNDDYETKKALVETMLGINGFHLENHSFEKILFNKLPYYTS